MNFLYRAAVLPLRINSRVVTALVVGAEGPGFKIYVNQSVNRYSTSIRAGEGEGQSWGR